MSAAYGSIMAGKSADAQGKFQYGVALRNQEALVRQAKAEREAAALAEERVARKEKIIKAGQRVAAAKSGVDLAGSSLAFLTDTAFQFSLERNLTLRTGLVRSQELIHKGEIIAAQGYFAKKMGEFTKRTSYITAGLQAAEQAASFGMALGDGDKTVSQPTNMSYTGGITSNFSYTDWTSPKPVW